MRAKVVLRAFTVNDGTTVQVPEGSIVLIVGPNNAGKSQALRDLNKLAASRGEKGVVIDSAEYEYAGNADDLMETFITDHSVVTSANSGNHVALGSKGRQQLTSIMSWWPHNPYLVGPYFVLLADTESRLTASRPAPAANLFSELPTAPLHRVYAKRELEDRLAKISKDAFGTGLILDSWSGGNQWALRFGEIEEPNSPRPPQEYLDRLRELPLLHEEGDGVRSMIGLLLTFLTGNQSLSLVDEPEAFLHPPQARYIARLLADEVGVGDGTIVASTHSTDVVHGAIEGAANATIVRLTRTGTTNHAAVLDNDAVERLWADPLLRYSNLLEGLFDDAAIICEAEADCKYFSAVWDTLDTFAGSSRRPDILFTSCGGKHKMHAAVSALRAAQVPVAVIGDFDVLNDWSILSRLVAAAGGDPAVIEKDWTYLNDSIKSTERNPSKAGLKEAVDGVFERLVEPDLTKDDLEKLRATLRRESGWDRVKRTGAAGISAGQPRQTCDRLLDYLAAHRIHLVPVGEMEDLVPSVGGKGSAWVAAVLESGSHLSTASDGSRELVRAVLESLWPGLHMDRGT